MLDIDTIIAINKEEEEITKAGAYNESLVSKLQKAIDESKSFRQNGFDVEEDLALNGPF